MASARLLDKKETLEGVIRYHRLLLAPAFTRHLKQRKKMLDEKIYHLRYIAQDCKDWKVSDLEAIKRGMEISILKYRLAKELAQDAREVLDEMFTDLYPHLTDPRGLEEKVWEVFENEEMSESDETERLEAERKLQVAGFVLPPLNVPQIADPVLLATDGLSDRDDEMDAIVSRETALVNQQTEKLLAILEEKKAQLENLRELDDIQHRSSSGEDSN